MSVKAIIFDMGGVTVRMTKHDKFVAFVKAANRQQNMRQKIFDFYEGKLSFQEIVEDISRTSSVFEEANSLRNFENANFMEHVGRTDELILGAVRRLRYDGYKVGLLTNNGYWSPLKRRSMIFDETNEFDTVMESCRVGMRKPQHGIFELMCEAMDIKPEESIMVDDSPQIVEAAQTVGMNTVLVQNQNTAKAIKEVYDILEARTFAFPTTMSLESTQNPLFMNAP